MPLALGFLARQTQVTLEQLHGKIQENPSQLVPQQQHRPAFTLTLQIDLASWPLHTS
jgi:hypothetical protein